MEAMQADKQPFLAAIDSMEARYYDQEFGPIKFTRKRKYGIPRKAYMDSKGSVEIRNEEAKLLNVTIIVPSRPMSGPIIKEIDDDHSQEEKAVTAIAIFKMKVK